MDEIIHTNEGRSRRFLGGLSLHGIAAIVAIALVIIGLSGIEPVLLLSIASVFLGFALMIGTEFTGRTYTDFSVTGIEDSGAGGTAFTSLAGLTGIVLGILSLIGMAPDILLPSAAIVFGCAMLLESSFGRIGNIPMAGESDLGGWSGSNQASCGINLLCGAAAIVLGILALNDYSPAVLTFVAFLTIGCASLLTGTSLIQRASNAVQRRF